MTSIAVSFLASAVVAAILTPAICAFANRRGILDAPGARKVHVRPVPRLGGVAIVAAFFVPVTALLLLDAGASTLLRRAGDHVAGMYVGGIIIALLGLYDDLKGAGARQKFIVQFAVAILMYVMGYQIEAISNPFGGGVIEFGWLAAPVTVLWFVGVMNAVNLIDGLDGLAGGVALIAVATLFTVALMDGKPLAALFCASLGGALVGFLFFNFNPARIFMGDTGSLFLGFILACFSITTSSKSSTTVALTVPVLALGLPILDTLLAMVRRIRAGRSPFSADREHIHHRLMTAGFSHRQTVIALYAVAGLLAAGALMVRASNNLLSALVVLSLALFFFVSLRLLSSRQGAGETDRVFTPPASAPRPELRRIFLNLLNAADTQSAADALVEMATLTGATMVGLDARTDERAPWLFQWFAPSFARADERDLRAIRVPIERDGAEPLAVLFITHLTGGTGIGDEIVPWELMGHALSERWPDFDWTMAAPPSVATPDAAIAEPAAERGPSDASVALTSIVPTV